MTAMCMENGNILDFIINKYTHILHLKIKRRCLRGQMAVSSPSTPSTCQDAPQMCHEKKLMDY